MVNVRLANSWTYSDWRSAFNAYQARELPANQIDFAGHPLDVAFDNAGEAWGLGEFGLAVTRNIDYDKTEFGIPLLAYFPPGDHDPDDVIDWTKPFSSAFFPHASGSDLGESIINAGSSMWAAQGGEQSSTATDNHSLLTRIPTASPNGYNSCAVPLPGDNNEVIGLAYDSKRDVVWFAESQGDHRQGSGTYSTVGWVKESGLGSRCQNLLDYGGDPRLTDSENDQLRASAQQVVNSLQCTPAQDSDVSAECVHIISGKSLPVNLAHMEYDAGTDALWMTNWYDNTLVKYSIHTRAVASYSVPAAYVNLPVEWQIAVNGSYVFLNEYNGNRILRFTKSSGAWSSVDIPVINNVNVHSIVLSGSKLWFTVADENYDASTSLGYIDTAAWNSSGAHGTIYNNWSTLPMNPNQQPGNKHSFRGIDARSDGWLAVSDHGDMAVVTLVPR